MSNLNKELKEYLAHSSGRGDSESLLPNTIKDLKIPSVKSWFSKIPPEDPSSSNSSPVTSSSSGSCFPALSHRQRIVGFLGCVIMGCICFSLAAMYAPLLLIKARKFSLLFTLGSSFSILSFSFLWGPINHLKHLFSYDRIFFTSIYLSSLFATLFFALSLQSTILTSIAAVIQVLALVCFVISNIPGGQTGLKFMSSICSSLVKKTASKVLPV